ncbi:hypothetical protein MA16_Dca025101 [Dendrobium catenatum]|uniref:Uncharacterized protein n=1 Tax=Dendrobium catenatum TaxID=906689 RepID=A0A2I0WWA6_9ASPA|nr:hypothetical protein MA16_Dca025101 [Dendrobium catenatum]
MLRNVLVRQHRQVVLGPSQSARVASVNLQYLVLQQKSQRAVLQFQHQCIF